eukprot:TRINITY_DN2739_c0_g1_i1.p2 TRINITY_DN2739_c0_g1~~TRINITY_DN2739_c0_g1_i1.p2  ORF type:complete len:500 (-),score=153.28 TRINITY_DN2739_c0_g1_i1:113-1612(-)
MPLLRTPLLVLTTLIIMVMVSTLLLLLVQWPITPPLLQLITPPLLPLMPMPQLLLVPSHMLLPGTLLPLPLFTPGVTRMLLMPTLRLPLSLVLLVLVETLVPVPRPPPADDAATQTALQTGKSTLSKAAQSAYNPEAATGRQDIYGQRQSMSQAGYASAAPFPAGNVPNPYAVRPIPHAGSPHFDTTQRIPLGQADGDVAAPGTGGGTTTAPAGPATGIPKMSPAELMKRGAVPANSNVPDPKSNPLTTQPQAVPNRAPGTNTPLAPASNSPSSAAQNVAQASANNQFNPKASYANGQLYAENGAMSMQDPLPQGPYNYWAKPSAANNKPGFVNDAYYKNHPFYSKFPAPAGPTGVSSDLPPSADAPAEAPAANPSGPKPPRLGKIAGQPDKRPAGVPAPPPPPPAPKAKHPIQAPSDDASSSSAASAASSSSSSSAASSDASDAEASSNGEPTASSVLGSDSGASLEEPASADLAHHEDSGAESASASSGDITGSGSA